MATLEERRQFFKHRPVTHTIHIGGERVAFANFPNDMQDKIKKRLAEKDEVMALGRKGILPGIKIDGKQITRENLKDFEVPEMSRFAKKPEKKEALEKKVIEKKEYSKSELNELSFKELKEIGNKLGTTDRSKANLIKEILKLQ